jgi:4-oxalocrotonate tautomerase
VPLVNVNMATGRTDAQKHALMAAITQAVHDTIGAPVPSIRVWITEFEPTEFMAGGETLADRRARGAREAGDATP